MRWISCQLCNRHVLDHLILMWQKLMVPHLTSNWISEDISNDLRLLQFLEEDVMGFLGEGDDLLLEEGGSPGHVLVG